VPNAVPTSVIENELKYMFGKTGLMINEKLKLDKLSKELGYLQDFMKINPHKSDFMGESVTTYTERIDYANGYDIETENVNINWAEFRRFLEDKKLDFEDTFAYTTNLKSWLQKNQQSFNSSKSNEDLIKELKLKIDENLNKEDEEHLPFILKSNFNFEENTHINNDQKESNFFQTLLSWGGYHDLARDTRPTNWSQFFGYDKAPSLVSNFESQDIGIKGIQPRSSQDTQDFNKFITTLYEEMSQADTSQAASKTP
jgi:hypothetical protein